jgi:hypothetical protein
MICLYLEVGKTIPLLPSKQNGLKNKIRRNVMQKIYRLVNFFGFNPSIFFGFVSLAGAFLTFAMKHSNRSLWTTSEVIIVILVILMSGFFFWIAWIITKFQSIERKYKDVFALNFPKNKLERAIQQPTVNLVLQQLSISFRNACTEKDQILGTLPYRNSLRTKEETMKTIVSLRSAESLVVYRKKQFWEAHTLARKTGMWTLKKSGDYLELK